jgi:hypothetical protein
MDASVYFSGVEPLDDSIWRDKEAHSYNDASCTEVDKQNLRLCLGRMGRSGERPEAAAQFGEEGYSDVQ